MSTSIILAIDAGSSSIRCSAYELHENGESTTQSLVRAMEGAHHAIPMTCVTPSTGHIRIHGVLTAIDECIDHVLELLRSSLQNDYQVVAIGFSTFVMNFVGVDEMGKPVGEEATLSYACNRRDVVAQCARLNANISSEALEALYQRTGAPLHSAYAMPQLLAFYDNAENKYICQQVHRWQTISSICLHRWTGGGKIGMPISYSEASWTGMLDFLSCTWDATMMQVLDSCDHIKACGGSIVNLLPNLVDFDCTDIQADTVLSRLRNGIPPHSGDGSVNPYWERWPKLRGKDLNNYNKSINVDLNESIQHCRLFLGVGDGAAANIGSKCGVTQSNSSGHRVAVTIGTSAAARVCIPLSINECPCTASISVPHGLFCYRVDKKRVVVGGALTDGGSAVEWARMLLNLQSQKAFDACLEKVLEHYNAKIPHLSVDSAQHTAAAGAVTMIPFLSGERSTGFRGSATACISGITRETTPALILYGCLEAVTLRLGAIINLITEVCCVQQQRRPSVGNDDISRTILVASGNALEQNSLWRQLIADCTGFNVIVDGDSHEGASRGVAVLIARNLQQSTLCEEILAVANESQPDLEKESRWVIATLDQDNLINAVSHTWHK